MKARTFVCCICGKKFYGYGNNPEPVKKDGECCEMCNLGFVIPARIAKVYKKN